jgi:hypothetical protein
MDNDKKLVTQIPLTRLWKDEEDVVAKRSRYLTTENIKQVLKEFPVEFVIADIGCKLQWIGLDTGYNSTYQQLAVPWFIEDLCWKKVQ